MKTFEQAPPAAEVIPAAPPRRAGTFTFGIVLVASGLVMLVSLFWPRLDFTWLLKGSPVILISLGIETLLAARHGQRVRYDWMGMLLCGLLVGTAVVLYVLTWCMLYDQELLFY